jgi:hypothetical protein
MAKFYTARQQGGWAPVIMELPSHIVIDGIPHDKQTLNPLYLKSIEYNNIDGICPFVFNRMWTKYTLNPASTEYRNYLCDPSFVKADGGLGIAKHVWPSSVSSDEIYILAPLSRTRFLRVHGTELSIMNNFSGLTPFDNGSYTGFVHGGPGSVYSAYIINERAASLDILIHMDYSPDSHGWTPPAIFGYCTKNSDTFEGMMLTKTTWTIANTNYLPTLTTTSAQVVQQSPVYTFIALSGQGVYNNSGSNSGGANYLDSTTTYGYFGRHRLIRSNRTTFGDNTTLFDITGDTYFATPAPTYSRLRGGTTSTHDYWVTLPTSTANFFKIYRCSFDFDSGGSGATQLATIDFAGTSFTLNGTHKGLTVLAQRSRAIYLRNYLIHTSTGTDFLGLTLCETSAESTEPLATFKTYLFSIDLSNQSSPRLVPIQVIDHSAKPREVFPMDADFRKIMIITDSYIAFMVFDEVANQYNEVNRYGVLATSVGMDELDRVWVHDNAGSVYLLSPFVPTRITVTWENADYDYTGTDISTHIDVSAYDAFGDRIAVDVTLTIDSLNCTFADLSKIKTITTSATADTQVNVVITGSGYVRILANTEL